MATLEIDPPGQDLDCMHASLEIKTVHHRVWEDERVTSYGLDLTVVCGDCGQAFVFDAVSLPIMNETNGAPKLLLKLRPGRVH